MSFSITTTTEAPSAERCGPQTSICQSLECVFGTPFELQDLESHDSEREVIDRFLDDRGLNAHTDGADRDTHSRVAQYFTIPHGFAGRVPDGRIALAIRVHAESGRGQIAVGLVPPAAVELIHSCVHAAFELTSTRNVADEGESRLAAYAEHLSESFEELVWLREMGRHVEHCRVNRTLAHVAGLLLKDLRDLVRAEAILLVHVDQSDRSSVTPGLDVLAAAGVDELTVASKLGACSRLINELRGKVSELPVVRNRSSCSMPVPGMPHVHSAMLLPIVKDGQEFGWLVAFNRCLSVGEHCLTQMGMLGADEFGTAEATLVQTAAAMLSTHGLNVKLFNENEELMLGVVKSLVRSLEARDEYTCGHSDRVAELSAMLAAELNLTATEVHDIYISGLLHDIGKVGIPDKVLNKPDRLTDAEFDVIKQHPVIGYEILKNLRQFEYVLPGVRHHHERIDGKGYPDGLTGEEIPLMARIMAVADAYDAMTSNRPYRKGMPFEKAESILRENSGPQWDPVVIDAFFRRLDDVRKICRHHEMESIMSRLETRRTENSMPVQTLEVT